MADRLDPKVLFDLIAAHVPSDLRPNILVVGSLAAAFHYREKLALRGVTTKDADVVIQPAGAIEECRTIARRLLAAGWRKTDKCWPSPQPHPHEALRAIRLYPPATEAYFIELLAFPPVGQVASKAWIPIELDDGWYGLPSFRFLGLTAQRAQSAPDGLMYAAPAMMALANLLSHPALGSDRMSEEIGGRTLLRSAKDLGRVLALARLAEREETEAWPAVWEIGLREAFPEQCAALAARAGDGLRALLEDPGAMDEARHAVDIGLLSGYGVTVDQLAALANQLLLDAIEPLVERCTEGAKAE